MWEIFVRYVAMPYTINGVTIPNNDNTYNIYINSNLSVEAQKQAYQHELKHIKNNHLYDLNCVAIDEMIANNEAV